jgi:aspartyl-tRNA(Asn)/glutamyl-tRNA(Gln) amidotransferase subunit C
MSVDDATVRRVARLARVAVAEGEVPRLRGELDAILAFVEELGSVDVAGVEPMTSVMPMKLAERVDRVTDGGDAARVLGNAPASEQGFFVVPKVIE